MKKGKAPLMLFFRVVFYLLPIISFLSVYISPAKMGLIGFLSLSVPFFMLYTFVGFAFNIYKKNWLKVLLWLGIALLSFPSVRSTIQFSISSPPSAASFSVLSYNVRVFNVYRELRKNEKQENRYDTSKKILQWLASEDAEIKCIQEFYNYNRSSIFQSTEIISRKGGYEHYIVPKFIDWAGAEFGLAIFSKFPIANKGVITFEKPTNNGAIYADIVVGSDTIRVVNVHLESMHLQQNMLSNSDSLLFYSKNIFVSIQKGIKTSASQVNRIYQYLEKSPYPFVITGDLNATPYSYVYQKLNKLAQNSFEAAGNGFGFTYNGKPSFLRIDHQYFSSQLNINKLGTLYQIDFTDHFPTKGSYQLK